MPLWHSWRAPTLPQRCLRRSGPPSDAHKHSHKMGLWERGMCVRRPCLVWWCLGGAFPASRWGWRQKLSPASPGWQRKTGCTPSAPLPLTKEDSVVYLEPCVCADLGCRADRPLPKRQTFVSTRIAPWCLPIEGGMALSQDSWRTWRAGSRRTPWGCMTWRQRWQVCGQPAPFPPAASLQGLCVQQCVFNSRVLRVGVTVCSRHKRVHVHVCVRACACVCVRLRASACVCVRVRASAYVCVRVRVRACACACVCVCVCVCLHWCLCAHGSACVRMCAFETLCVCVVVGVCIGMCNYRPLSCPPPTPT
jgi:hypothetical protein